MSLVLTLMQPLRAEYAAQMDKNELRESRYGAWEFFKQQTALSSGILDAQTQENVKKSFGNTVQIPVLDAKDVTISNVRSCTIADDENTSKLLTLTFVTYSFGFTMAPGQYFNNNIKYETDFTRKLKNYLLKFASVLDTASYAKLNTERNIFWPSNITSYYPQVSNALQVTAAEQNDFYNNLQAIMEEADFYGNTNIISSTSGKPIVRRLKAQGAANDENDAFQFSGYDWFFSNRIVNGSGVKNTLFAIPDGQVAVINRNDPDAIMGSHVGDIKVWSEVDVPIVNMKMASYHYEDCADKSALHAGTTGLTRTKIEGFEWSTDVCFVTAYNSAPSTRFSPIFKAEISAS